MEKQQGACTTCFLGIILVGKEKLKTKGENNTKPKKAESITFCCGDCVGIGIGVSWLSQGEGRGTLGLPCRLLQEEPQKEKKKASWGPNLSIQ